MEIKIGNQKNEKFKKLNILFVNMPSLPLADFEASFSNKGLRLQSVSMPLGIMYISSYLKKNGNYGRIGLLDYVLSLRKLLNYEDIDDFMKSVAEQEVEFVPDVIAFSLNFSASYHFFLRSLNILSRMWPKAMIVVGGVHATNSIRTLLELPEVNYVVRGEGEISFIELVNQLSLSKKIDIKGVYSKDKFLNSTELELCDWAVDLDELPFPDWELIDMNTYMIAPGRQKEMGVKHRMASLITTRGCPGICTFCSSHTVHGRKMRFRSIKNIINEIKLLHEKYGIVLFMPEDDLFTVGKERIQLLLKGIRALEIPGIEIQTPAALSVNTLDEEIIDDLIGAGMKIAVLAIESGSKYVQNHIIKKNCNLDKAKQLVDIIKNKGIMVRCYFIFGFPGETKGQMQETVDYAKSLGADWCVFNIATPLVGSEMYDQFINLGVIKDNEESWLNTVFDSRQFDTPEITARELNDFVYRANLECNFLNNPNKVGGQFKKAILIYQDIVLRYPFHIIAWHCLMECYKGLGDNVKVEQIKGTVENLIKTDKRAEDMFIKYGDLMS